MFTMNKNAITDSAWYPNSGIANHITPDLSNISLNQIIMVLTNSTLLMV